MTTVEIKTLFVAWLVGLAHLVSGIGVLMASKALLVTPLASLHQLNTIMGWPNYWAGAVLMVAGVMAIAGSSTDLALRRRWHVFLFFPQQILLLLMLWSITVAWITGIYPDGYKPAGGSYFIQTDQVWAWVLAASHSAWLAVYVLGDHQHGSNY